MTFTRLDLIRHGIDEYEANEIVKNLAKATPCTTKSIPMQFIRHGVMVDQLCQITVVSIDKALSVCDKKLSYPKPKTKVKRWIKLQNILNNMKEI